jgi:pyruvate dehydrogenase E2 component (dihydrolipoamide acetyltransferase)
MARDLGIDLRRVKGSERGGRVVLEDLRRYIQGLQHLAHAPRVQTSAEQAPQPVRVDFARWGPVESRKMSTLRKTISTKMVESWTAVPHVTQFDNADVTRILDLRKKYAGSYEAKGARLTLTSFALRSIVNTLKRHPVFNASMGEASGEIVYKQYYHLGIAVDTEHGLIVPVIRDVDKKSLLQISVELQELAQRTRDRKVSLEEMQGGTFSISNQGGIGSGHFTPIINTPELAILGMGKGVLTPVIRDGSVVPKTLLPLSLSYDHRLIDGADAARFMVDLVHDMENFPEDDVTI